MKWEQLVHCSFRTYTYDVTVNAFLGLFTFIRLLIHGFLVTFASSGLFCCYSYPNAVKSRPWSLVRLEVVFRERLPQTFRHDCLKNARQLGACSIHVTVDWIISFVVFLHQFVLVPSIRLSLHVEHCLACVLRRLHVRRLSFTVKLWDIVEC